MATLKELFEEHTEDEFLEFERIEKPLHPRRDLCAFLMPDQLQPGDEPMICDASHGEFFLSIDAEKMAPLLTSDLVRDLVRCGLRYDVEGDEGFAFFA